METAKKSHKKLWITLTAIVVVLAILVFLVLGMLRGFGPGHALYNSQMAKEAGNSATYDFDQIERLKGNPLEGKHLAVLGSSVTYGAASLQNSLGEYFQQRFGIVLVTSAVVDLQLHAEEAAAAAVKYRAGLITVFPYGLILAAVTIRTVFFIFIAVHIIRMNDAAALLAAGVAAFIAGITDANMLVSGRVNVEYPTTAALADSTFLTGAIRTDDGIFHLHTVVIVF